MLTNPYLGTGLLPQMQLTRSDAAAVSQLLTQCPRHAQTPLHDATELAEAIGIARLFIKDESQRMGLGSFKALGAAHAIAKDAAATGDPSATSLAGQTYVAASAGNHGLSVAAGAAIFGARAIIYLADSVPEAFAERLRAKGADVVRAGSVYEESMEAAAEAATSNGWRLLSDSTWDGYIDPALAVMEGYLQLASETADQLSEPPTHIMLQAGVGGMAAAIAAHARATWGSGPEIIVVEPEHAPALIESVRAGAMTTTDGPVSDMGRLDCKTPSMVALATLSRDANAFLTISESDAAEAVARLAGFGYPTTPSGGAGLAAVMAGAVALSPDARVLTILSEGPEDG